MATEAGKGGKLRRAVHPALPLRDAFKDWAHVRSDLRFEGEDQREPLLTIAIPTFRRGALLVEAVASAIAQDFNGAIEVIVVDNDPQSRGYEQLLAQLPQLRRANFRYYVNAENIGMFGNWNRCVELGRGSWHALLNDDDLLDASFVTSMLAILADARIDGLVSRKRALDERNPQNAARLARRASLPVRILKRVRLEAQLFGKQQRRVSPRMLFFGNFLGNPVGLVARKADLIALGGYYPEDYPSADYYFLVRFAYYLNLHQTRGILASIRIAENESARPEVVRGFLAKDQVLRDRLTGVGVPGWWRGISPMLVADQRAYLKNSFSQEVSDEEIRKLGVRVVRHRPWLLRLTTTSLIGF